HDADVHALGVVIHGLQREIAKAAGDFQIFVRKVQIVVCADRVGDGIHDALPQVPLGDEHVVPCDAEAAQVGVRSEALQQRLSEVQVGAAGVVFGSDRTKWVEVGRAETHVVSGAPTRDAAHADADVAKLLHLVGGKVQVEALDAAKDVAVVGDL